MTGKIGLGYSLFSLDIRRPISNSIHIGIAKKSCEKISGGVNSIPIVKKKIIKYGLALERPLFVTTFDFISKNVAIGISKDIPKAKASLKIKLR